MIISIKSLLTNLAFVSFESSWALTFAFKRKITSDCAITQDPVNRIIALIVARVYFEDSNFKYIEVMKIKKIEL